MSTKKVLVFIGPPGAGKGSLSRVFVEQLGWKRISTGDLCRKHIQEQTEIGKEIDFAIKSGKLVSDALVSQMVADWLKEHQEYSLILDGFPRTVPQAQNLQKLMEEQFSSLKVVIIRLIIPEAEVIERISTRRVCLDKSCQTVYSLRTASLQSQKKNICDRCKGPIGQRADDTREAVIERLKTYYVHEKPLLEFYNSMGYSLPELDVSKSIESIFTDLKKIMEVGA